MKTKHFILKQLFKYRSINMLITSYLHNLDYTGIDIKINNSE